MKGALDRTKVVLRHLPPSLSEAALLAQIDAAFADRYNWFSFRPGKISQKHISYSRAYIDFKRPDDVVLFAEFFNGHVFVNEKGSQFKVIVEYAPSQRVPRQWSKKDGRDGTIYKDSEYLEFLELLSKPVENLPSAEIQLEKREAERSGAAKDIPISTPLMDFVRQKRAAKGPRRSLSNGKVSRRGTSSNGSPSSGTSRRGSGKKRVSATMYVARHPGKNATIKDRSIYTLVPSQGDQHISSKASNMAPSDGKQTLDENGVSGNNDAGKKKVLLLKGKEREIIAVSDLDSMSQHHNVTSSAKEIVGATVLKQNQRHEGSGRIIRSILSKKELRQSQSSRAEHQIQTSNLEKEKQSPRPVHVQPILKGMNGISENKIGVHDSHVSSERQERHTRHKDRPDRGVWTSSNGADESVSSAASSQVDPFEGRSADLKHDMPNARSGEVKSLGGVRTSHSSENGFNKHFGRRGPTHGVKDVDSYSVSSDGKHPRRSGTTTYGSNEKQVWVQKASSGT
ncbi:Regulator of nonsense transcripts [Vigna angularis]|uniref:Regulator of nonsense transcripts n=2 Tax=Phaseolus angularis TaxID=3914 RepID=A0A8T0K9G1_PHAAN|nr:regulator of nonsense transcripts UPF3 [Vigna angularis]XP_052734933.1 regulator of nonsense transcripts UPF3 [Vigna angularis]KAG2396390.1 Regulator of nonsense transcripts [Vigna angularis]BAT86718.1 hypothetical protein VIGAN_05002000 [Vigna angularis var. angularis]